ncbi:unnamed protein product [Nesidiocoris tenuis]|uniref:MHD domain-containing protein n=1 Tax=Nesidiocoris tenuis TaxID=355587 RepID=A0A6H5HF32_9HEMI|nr:unnamed protein product [Nesidiocoris tenuis]
MANPFLFTEEPSNPSLNDPSASFNPFLSGGMGEAPSDNPFMSAYSAPSENDVFGSSGGATNPFAFGGSDGDTNIFAGGGPEDPSSNFNYENIFASQPSAGMDIFGTAAQNEIPQAAPQPAYQAPPKEELMFATTPEQHFDQQAASEFQQPKRPPPPRPGPPKETKDLILSVTGAMEATSSDLLDRLQATRTPSPTPMRDLHSPSPTQFGDLLDVDGTAAPPPTAVPQEANLLGDDFDFSQPAVETTLAQQKPVESVMSPPLMGNTTSLADFTPIEPAKPIQPSMPPPVPSIAPSLPSAPPTFPVSMAATAPHGIPPTVPPAGAHGIPPAVPPAGAHGIPPAVPPALPPAPVHAPPPVPPAPTVAPAPAPPARPAPPSIPERPKLPPQPARPPVPVMPPRPTTPEIKFEPSQTTDNNFNDVFAPPEASLPPAASESTNIMSDTTSAVSQPHTDLFSTDLSDDVFSAPGQEGSPFPDSTDTSVFKGDSTSVFPSPSVAAPATDDFALDFTIPAVAPAKPPPPLPAQPPSLPTQAQNVFDVPASAPVAASPFQTAQADDFDAFAAKFDSVGFGSKSADPFGDSGAPVAAASDPFDPFASSSGAVLGATAGAEERQMARTDSQETPPTPLFDEDVSQPLEEFPRIHYTGPGWEMMLRQPNKKKITGQRFWKKIWVKLVHQGESPVLQLYNGKDDKDPFQELPLQPCYSVSDIGESVLLKVLQGIFLSKLPCKSRENDLLDEALEIIWFGVDTETVSPLTIFWHLFSGAQQFDQYGKIFTVKLQFVFYKERPGVRPGQVTKAERITNKLSQFAAYAIQGDYQGVKEFGSDLKKLGLPVEHAPQISQLFKIGSHSYEDMKQFSMCVEESLFKLSAHRDRALTYKMEEVQITAVDELYVEQNANGTVEKQIARVRLFFLAFLSGMPDVELGVNDLVRQGKEVVGRHDIIPVVTEEWIRLEAVEFHSCVQLDEYERTRTIKFKPPDAMYLELMRFRVRPPRNRELPLQLKCTICVTGNKVEIHGDILVPGFTSRKLGQIPCEDVCVRIPIPECWIYQFRVEKHFRYGSVKSAHRRTGKVKGIERFLGAIENMEPSLMEVTSGQAKYEHQHRAIVWRMPRLPKEGQGAYTTHNLVVRLQLTSYDQIPDELAKYAYVEFTMPATTVSHTTVRSVSIQDSDSDAPPEKYVRQLARCEYRVEIEHTQGEGPADYIAATAVSKPAPIVEEKAPAAPPPVSDSDSDSG